MKLNSEIVGQIGNLSKQLFSGILEIKPETTTSEIVEALEDYFENHDDDVKVGILDQLREFTDLFPNDFKNRISLDSSAKETADHLAAALLND